MTLGVLPLLIWGAGAAAAAIAAGTGAWTWKQHSDYDAWTKTVPAPAPPPVRTAPQTQPEMTDPRQWSPEIERDRYRQVWEAWRRQAIPDNPDTLPNPGNDDGLIIAAAVVGLAAVWSLRK